MKERKEKIYIYLNKPKAKQKNNSQMPSTNNSKKLLKKQLKYYIYITFISKYYIYKQRTASKI